MSRNSLNKRDLIDRLEQAEADLANWKSTAISRGERLEQAEQAVQRVREFSGELRFYCSPHGVAADYADKLDRALEGEQA